MKTKNVIIKKIKRHTTSGKTQKGFTLIEVLVAIVLLGLAFTSMILLQTNSLRYSATAYYRGIAAQVANGLASSIRVNSRGLSNYTFTTAYNPSSAIPVATCIGPTTCNPAAIAAADIAWARQSARNQLPGGDLQLKSAAGIDKNYVDVTLIWIPAAGKAHEINAFPCDAGVADAYTTAQCMDIRVKI